MAKTSRKSAISKKLEALARSQKISELLKLGGIQSQALLDSAGESTSTADSHVADLLNSGNFGRGAESVVTPAKAAKARAKAPQRRKRQKVPRRAKPQKRKKGRR